MLLSLRKKRLTSLFKEVRVFKVSVLALVIFQSPNCPMFLSAIAGYRALSPQFGAKPN